MSIKFKGSLKFLLIGIPLFVRGLFWAYDSVKFLMSAVQVSSSVIGSNQVVCTKDKRPYTCYQPVVEYLYAGKKHVLALHDRSSSQYTIGEKVELKVDRINPGVASTNSDLWIGPISLILIGSIFGGCGLFKIRSHFLKKKLDGKTKTINAA